MTLTTIKIQAHKRYQGLTDLEAVKKLAEFGFNTGKPGKKKTWLTTFVKIIAEPMMLLLIATAITYLFIGDRLEAIILCLSLIPIIFIEFFQERRTDHAIEALSKMLAQYASVYRDGKIIKLEIKYIVPGDLIYIASGDRIAADGYLVKSPGISVDESMLTGESIPVTKTSVKNDKETITAENSVLQGTVIVQGEGHMIVTSTGENTSYGKIGHLLKNTAQKETPLQIKITKLVKMVAIVAIVVAIIVGAILTFTKSLTEGLLGGLTMALSLIPEEFPVVFSVFLIMGVWRMTKQKSLVREMSMVEILGSTTVICTDKTGTLTEGKMSLEQIYCQDKIITSLKKEQDVCNETITAALFSLEQIASDPIEIEVQRHARLIGIHPTELYQEHDLIYDKPFDAKTKLVSHVWKNKSNDVTTQYTAGAPESIFKICHMTGEDLAGAEKTLSAMSAKAYRVIGIAQKTITDNENQFPLTQHKFCGLLAMSDPPRVGVKEAIDMCQRAGIRIIMITGDNALTAHSVAEQIGLNHHDEVASGTNMENLSPDALKEIVNRHDIFARVHPEQKYLIVQALQESGHIVAMTGDGVNDAPALKKADIGIAMGQKGTEAARGAAGIILLDDNFATIVNSVKEGRRIYDNLRQAFVFLFSFHIPIVGMAILPLLLGHPLIFLPVHIIFLELICDPVSVLGFDREKPRQNLMSEPPRSTKEPLINPKLWTKILLQGFTIFAITFGFYYYFAVVLGQMELGRTMAFYSLVISQIMIIILSREWHQIKSNFLLIIIPIITVTWLFIVNMNNLLQTIFRFVQLNSANLILVFVVPPVIFIIIELITSLLTAIKSKLIPSFPPRPPSGGRRG